MRLPLFAFCVCFLTAGVAHAQEVEPSAPPTPEVESSAPEAVPPLEPASETEDGEAEETSASVVEEEPTVGRARRHFQAGVELTGRELWEAALAEFEESLRLMATRNALLNRAVCLENLRRYQESVEAFRDYLERYGDALTPERRVEVERHIAEIRSLLTEVHLDIRPPGALIVVGGRAVGQAPITEPLLLPSGQHRIEVIAEGYESQRDDILVVLGRPIEVELELEREPTQGFLRVVVNAPTAELTIDGRDAGPAPYEGHLRPGQHIIVARAPGYRPHDETIDIDEGDERLLRIELENRRLHRAWFWSVVGLTLASVSTATALGITALANGQEYDYLDPGDAALYDQTRDIILATDIMLGFSIGGAIATLVLGLVTDWPRRQRALAEE